MFRNPLPAPPELKGDSQILGTWTRTVKLSRYESKEQLSVFERSSGWIDAVFIYDIDSETSLDGINVLTFEGYSTSVNDQRFLCLRLRAKDFAGRFQEEGRKRSDQQAPEFPFFIFSYRTPSRDKLVVTSLSALKVAELIDKGKLEGAVSKEDMFKGVLFSGQFNGQSLEDVLKAKGLPPGGVTVTSSSDELVEVISREGVGAFISQDANDIRVFSRGKM